MMQTLTIQANPQAEPAVYTPKLTYSFYKQCQKDQELKDNGSDGFSGLVNGLLDQNVDAIVAFYYHALAWYKRNQPSESAVADALEDTVFKDEATTEAEFTSIVESLKSNNFLARKLDETVKNNDKLTEQLQKRIETMDDNDQQKTQYEIGIDQINDSTTRLQQMLQTPASSPKPEDVDSHQEN